MPNSVMNRIGECIDYHLLESHDALSKPSSNFRILNNFKTGIEHRKSNSAFAESVYDIEEFQRFPEEFHGYRVAGVHTWSDQNSTIVLMNEELKIAKIVNKECQFHDYVNPFYIDGKSGFKGGNVKDALMEKTFRTEGIEAPSKNIGLIGFLLLKEECSFRDCSHSKVNDLTSLLIKIGELLVLVDEYHTWQLNRKLNKSIVRKVFWRLSEYFNRRV